MCCKEARLWRTIAQVWLILFAVALLRIGPAAGLPAVFLSSLTLWLVAGGLSFAFLCRMRCTGELSDLSVDQVWLRLMASIPLGVVSLLHTLDQIERRDLLDR